MSLAPQKIDQEMNSFHDLVLVNLPLAYKMANRFFFKYIVMSRVMELDDVKQIAAFGLLLACSNYKPASGNFYCYIQRCIRGTLINWLRKYNIFKVPSNFKAIKNGKSIKEDIYKHKIATDYDLMISIASSEDPTKEITEEDTNNYIQKVVSSLPEKEQNIIKKRYWKNTTLQELADELNITRQGVKYHEDKILTNLKERLHGY